MKKINGIIYMLWFVSFTSTAQSVEEFITMANDYSPELTALKLEYESAKQKENQVKDWPDPVFNVGIGILPIETRLGAQRLKLGVTQMIPWKGLLNAQAEVERAKAETLSFLDEVKEIDIEYYIRTSYSLLQNLDDQKIIIEERLKVLDVLEELAKSSVRSGQGKLSNVLLIERKRMSFIADLELLDKKKQQPTILINSLVGREIDSDIILVPFAPPIFSKNEVLQLATHEHPSLKGLDNRLKASMAKSEVTDFQSKPRIGVGLDYALIAKRPNTDIVDNGRDVLMPMGSISIPLQTKRYGAIRQEEKLRQNAILSRKEDLKDKFITEIEIAYSNIEYQDQIIDKYKSLQNITQETLQLMREEYAAEGSRFEELLRLEMELIDYGQMIVNAKYEKHLAIAKLMKYKG